MHKYIEPLQYITSGSPAEQIQQVERACASGIRWIQLRIKNEPLDVVLSTAKEVKTICQKYGVIFIINDHLDIAKKVNADGVHLGKEDLSPLVAKELLGEDKIIGGTANTFDDIKALYSLGVDYIGLGPFRFTQTKEKLSPILGMQGYLDIYKNCITEKINIPIVAIGGITPSDTEDLLKTGIYGIAVSSAITHANNKNDTIASFYNTLKQEQA